MTCHPDVLDRAVLARLDDVARAGDSTFVRRLIELFLADTPVRLDQLRAAAQRHDAAAVRNIAHTIKGGAATFGAREVVHSADELEQLADGADATRATAALDASFEHARRALLELLEEHVGRCSTPT